MANHFHRELPSLKPTPADSTSSTPYKTIRVLTLRSHPDYCRLQRGPHRAVGYRAGTPSSIFIFLHSGDRLQPTTFPTISPTPRRYVSRASPSTATTPSIKSPPFHILTSQFCTAVSIDTCTAIARFFVGFGKIPMKIPISGYSNAQKARLKPEPSLSPEGLTSKA